MHSFHLKLRSLTDILRCVLEENEIFHFCSYFPGAYKSYRGTQGPVDASSTL